MLDKKPLVVIDIQPEYLEYAQNEIDMALFIQTLINHEAMIYYVFVGEGIVDDDKEDVIMMLEEFGVPEETIAHMKFIEKDYGWIREQMEDPYLDFGITDTLGSGRVDYAIERLEPIPNDVYICGGGRNECLAEVMHTLDYMDRKYEAVESFIY